MSIEQPAPRPISDLFEEWVGGRSLQSASTNNGSRPLAFQSWHRFKEAFAPELVRRAINDSPLRVRSCLDPFGGSGTTALTAQFLGIDSTTTEINPFLVDVITSKLASYQTDGLTRAIVDLRHRARTLEAPDLGVWAHFPPTFVEPGVNGRWIFGRLVAEHLAKMTAAIDHEDDPSIRRLFRVLLGGLLVDVSNVVVSGKGRRYRRNWNLRAMSPDRIDRLFFDRAQAALIDIHRFASRPSVRADVMQADARSLRLTEPHDLAVCSPPYPNSFDYTDVYNIELWVLGYLNSGVENRELRHATLSSHVQLHRQYAAPPRGSPTLESVLQSLDAIKTSLWSPWIHSMIGAYFADLVTVFTGIRASLRPGATLWLVVGDSRYGGVDIPVARVLGELAPDHGWRVLSSEPFRDMKSSAQQGGRAIPETLVVFQRT